MKEKKKWMSVGWFLGVFLMSLLAIAFLPGTAHADALKGPEYSGGGDADAATVRPSISLSQEKITLSEAMNNVTIYLTISGADYKYCSTGFYIKYDSNLTLIPNVDDQPAELEEAGSRISGNASKIGDNGLFLGTTGTQNKGMDGNLWSIIFKVPENCKAGDKYPIELYYISSGANEVVFSNNTFDEDDLNMQAYAFTEGITHGYIEIIKESASLTVPDANNRIADGKEQPLVTGGKAEGGTLYYARGNAAGPTEEYSATVPKESAEGTYYVWCKAKGDDDHEDSAAKCVTTKICFPVTFKVIGGEWDNGGSEDRIIPLSRYDNEDLALRLTEDDIPKAGSKPAEGYKAEGAWDEIPPTEKVITEAKTYIFRYVEKKSPIDKKLAKISLDAGLKGTSSKGTVKAKWGKVKEADSYDVYAAYCEGNSKYKKFKTVSGKTTKLVIKKLAGKKLNPKRNVKFYIVAYKTVNGKKVKLAKSLHVHVVGSANKSFTNIKSIKVTKKAYKLKKGKTAKIKAKLVLYKKGKKTLDHEPKFRYATSNDKVAKVSKKGKIKAVGKGKCDIYVYAQNGCAKKIKVTVK